MFKQLCKHFPITLRIRQPIFTRKTYNHEVTYNHASADSNLPLIVNQTFSKTEFIIGKSGFAILCFFNKPNVWYLWGLKILAIKRWFPLNFTKNLLDHHFVVGGPKNFKHLSHISFDSGFQNIVLPSLLLFSCVCY